jgi:signal transduction histidine kinase
MALEKRRRPAHGPVRRAFDVAVWESTALGLALWQLLVGALDALRRTDSPWLLAAHGLFWVAAVAAVVVLRRSAPSSAVHVWVPAGFYGLLLVLLGTPILTSGDDLVVVVCAMSFTMASTPFLLLPWRVAALCSGVPAGVLVVLLLADSERQTAGAIVLPALMYSVGAMALIARVHRFADDADSEGLRAAAQTEALAVARARSRTHAELARTLHDTVVNTLTLVSVGAGPGHDRDALRARCAADVEAVLEHRAGEARRADLRRAADGLAVDVRWTGDGVPDRESITDLVGREAATALGGIVRELLLNVEKHAGTGSATVEVTVTGSALALRVQDHGVGFVDIGAGAVGRGLRESVLARADEVGADVRVESDPGQGTVVAVSCPRTDVRDVGDDVPRGPGGAERLLRLTAWGWCVALCGGTVVLLAIGGRSVPAFASAGVVAAACATAWLVARRHRHLSAWSVLLLVLAVPAAQALSVAGFSSQGTNLAYWQAIGLSPLFVVLLVVARDRRAVAWAAAALVAATVVLALAVRESSPLLAGVTVANGLMQLAQLNVWNLFVRAVARASTTAVRAREQVLEARADRAVVEAAGAAQERWNEAQADHALDLLRAVAGGAASPDDPAVRRHAAREARAMRGLLELDADLVNLGPWVARCIAAGRDHDVDLTVRLGHADLPTADDAADVGRLLLALVAQAPPGSPVVLAHFGGEHRAVTLVGPHGFVDVDRLDLDGAARGRVRVTPLLEQDLVEVLPIGPTPPPSLAVA